MPDPGEVVDRLAHDSTIPPRPSRSYESSPASASPFAPPLLAREARRQDLVDPLPLDDDRAVRVEHDDVALPDPCAADLDGLTDAPGTRFSAPLTERTAPRSAARRLAAPGVAHRSVHQQRGTPATFACVASSSPTSATGLGSGIVRTTTSPGTASATAAWTIRLSSLPQRTVRAGGRTRARTT